MDREEAIRRIKAWNLDSDDMEVLTVVIPELTESEDERMLRTIIRGFENWKSNGNVTFNNTKVDDILAYLEKQKEEEGYEAIPVESTLEYKLGFKAGKESEKQKERGPLTKEEEYILHRIIEYLEDETCPSEWISLLHDIYCLPYEKQKEQKPENYGHEMWKNCEANFEGGKQEVINNPEKYGLQKIQKIEPPRPSWKPTKGQLESIRYLLEDYSPWLINSADERKDLRDVYEHLKRL